MLTGDNAGLGLIKAGIDPQLHRFDDFTNRLTRDYGRSRCGWVNFVWEPGFSGADARLGRSNGVLLYLSDGDINRGEGASAKGCPCEDEQQRYDNCWQCECSAVHCERQLHQRGPFHGA